MGKKHNFSPFLEINFRRNVRKGGRGGTPQIRNLFFGENFVRKGGGVSPLTDKIRKVVFDVLPYVQDPLNHRQAASKYVDMFILTLCSIMLMIQQNTSDELFHSATSATVQWMDLQLATTKQPTRESLSRARLRRPKAALLGKVSGCNIHSLSPFA